jgi:hypothetical protein
LTVRDRTEAIARSGYKQLATILQNLTKNLPSIKGLVRGASSEEYWQSVALKKGRGKAIQRHHGKAMGRSYLFECSRCGYKAKVSGGPDRGLDCSVQTIACRECKKLYDAVTRLKVVPETMLAGNKSARLRKISGSADGPPDFDEVLSQLPFSGGKFKWAQYKVRCPISPTHKVQIWKDPGKCPRCSVFLEKSPLPFRLWD